MAEEGHQHAYINEQKNLTTHYSFLLNKQNQDNIQVRAYTITMFSLFKNRTGI
jgi:CRISPR/Cas system CMR-associated protein Cmr5 small subunit